MAKVEVQWPSEDEDFDAVSVGKDKSGVRASNQAHKASKPVAKEAVESSDAEKTKAVEVLPETPEQPAIDIADESERPSEEAGESVMLDQAGQESDETTGQAARDRREPAKAVETEQAVDELPKPGKTSRAAPDELETTSKDTATQTEENATLQTAQTPVSDHDKRLVEEAERLGTMKAYPQTAKKSRFRRIARGLFELMLVAGLIGLGLWSWTLAANRDDLRKQVDQVNANPQALVQKQTNDLLGQVGQLTRLPTGETPTVANVSDASQAKQHSTFFAKAEDGDKVLMYAQAGEAILYRPSENKIILSAPLTFTSVTTANATQSGTSTGATTAVPKR